jgi:hypothetical protein
MEKGKVLTFASIEQIFVDIFPIKNLATFCEMVTLKCECEGFSTLKGKKGFCYDVRNIFGWHAYIQSMTSSASFN